NEIARRHEDAALLHVGHIELQLLFIQSRLTHVTNDAHNRQPRIRRIRWSNLESFPDGVFTRPIPFGETAVDNGDRRRVRRIVYFEKAATLKRNAHRAEVVRTDNAKERKRQLHITRSGASLDREA